MLSVSEAQRKLLETLIPVETEITTLTQAAGKVLGEAIVADLDYPPFSNSSMDGFAVKAADLRGASTNRPKNLKVVDDLAAGYIAGVSLKEGEAIRIMTGAPVPKGADTVIPVEMTDFNTRDSGSPLPGSVNVFQSVEYGSFVRQEGEDFQKGTSLISPGHRLRPQEIGLLAMLGKQEIVTYRVPRVGLFSTGDELLPLDANLEPGKIRETNSYTLGGLVASCGAEPIYLGIAKDRQDAVKNLLDDAIAKGVDLIVSSAGVSVGAFDFVRKVIEKFGKLGFWKVNMRPGKPIAFGSYQQVPFVGLPGNPVSAFVGFEVFLRPALYLLAGLKDWSRKVQKVRLLEPIESDGRESYLRAIITFKDGEWVARPLRSQSSGNLFSLTQSDGLIVLPAEESNLQAGAEIDAWYFSFVP
ncbi:MAG: molybdopterin molybdotransferase MoeA [Chloroflexi bacterium]|nr:molybdopterin molybdotransferase MoeA [Chloroflexota bacterium]